MAGYGLSQRTPPAAGRAPQGLAAAPGPPVEAGGLRGDDPVVDSIVRANQAIMTLAEDSVHEVRSDVTLTQYRALVALSEQGPCQLGDLAHAMGVGPSTATRMCDRLVRKGLIDRTRHEVDRREIVLSLTDAGEELVHDVAERRRTAVAVLLHSLPPSQLTGMVRDLDVLTGLIVNRPAGAGRWPVQSGAN